MHTELLKRAVELAQRSEAGSGNSGYGLIETLQQKDQELRRFCQQALQTAATGRALPPTDTWLVDNYSYIHSQIREIREDLPRNYYRHLPRLEKGAHRGQPRIHLLAAELVSVLESSVSIELVREFFRAFQEIRPLTLAELWAIGPMLKLVLIECLCEAARTEQRNSPEAETAVSNAVVSLRRLETVSWRDLVESISLVDRILREDPAGIYPRMEFESRDAYRHEVEGISRRSRASEEEVARHAVELARESTGEERRRHVGYFLIGSGSKLLKRRVRYHAPLAVRLRRVAYALPNLFFVGGVVLLTALIVAAFEQLLPVVRWWYVAVLVLPASQAAVSLMNRLVNLLIPPRRLPRLDFSEGIPDDCRTFVVVPTLLLSRPGVENLLENLEIHFLANRDPNLLFALLTDFPDARTPNTDKDELLDLCAEGIRRLNQRYGRGQRPPFYLFHRGRQWNPSESVWMGPERKRGKLNDFNMLLLGEGDAFETKIGDLSALSEIRYVITLDSDTQLPRDTARKMIGTMAHPLNQPVLDPRTRIVRDGYSLMQPRVSISMESAGRSRLARIYSGQTGFDPYTTAVSDVYQDLYGQASFTGKGIYDLRAFHAATEGRFPDNALLSHDLIEGEHVRVGLLTDLELIDDYPTTYQAFCKRKHRWVRGDWQIALWLLPWVPDALWRWRRNPLPLLSRWKIFDNLRRSLVEPALLLLLVCGWFTDAARSWEYTLAAIALLLLPAYLELLLALVRIPPRRFWRPYFRETGFRLVQGHVDAALNIAFLAHQSFLMVDAAVRTLIRRIITRRRLLEWESMAQAESSAGQISLMDLYLYVCPFVAVAGAPLLREAGGTLSLWLVELWIVSPLLAIWLNGRPRKRQTWDEDHADFLRETALRTWRYFADFSEPEHHWLVPDNVQEDPPAVAHRASPTNIGLQMTAQVAAFDFGYVTPQELAAGLTRVFDTVDAMDKLHGHLYNWYDTRTLLQLPPHFVSSVDSGNLAACLVIVKQACLGAVKQPLLQSRTLGGLRDHCICLRNLLPEDARSGPLMRQMDGLLKQLDYRPNDLFFWEGVLTEAATLARGMRQHLEFEASRLNTREAQKGDEIRYWYGLLLERMDGVLRDLYDLAPWLAEPYELELRLRSNDPALKPLISELERIPALGELPAHYDAIEECIQRRFEAAEAMHPALRNTFEQLIEHLHRARVRAAQLIHEMEDQAARASRMLQQMDFKFLFDLRRKLLRVGYDADATVQDDSCYDLLASEARTAVLLGIAKGDLPRESWFRLGRKLTTFRGHRVLLSWSGTMFEYLMPFLFMRSYEQTLLGECARAVVRVQQLYGRERNVPWGISEAAYSARDSALNYQYHAFGVPALSMKNRSPENLVVAPYASLLALQADQPAATENLREMARRGWTGRYGFIESIDFHGRSSFTHPAPTVVRAHMVHHQGMGLMALANVLLGNPMQKRFHAEPLVMAAEYLLQERVPALVDITPDDAPLEKPEGVPAAVTVEKQSAAPLASSET